VVRLPRYEAAVREVPERDDAIAAAADEEAAVRADAEDAARVSALEHAAHATARQVPLADRAVLAAREEYLLA
jgi:hypothetical protein